MNNEVIAILKELSKCRPWGAEPAPADKVKNKKTSRFELFILVALLVVIVGLCAIYKIGVNFNEGAKLTVRCVSVVIEMSSLIYFSAIVWRETGSKLIISDSARAEQLICKVRHNVHLAERLRLYKRVDLREAKMHHDMLANRALPSAVISTSGQITSGVSLCISAFALLAEETRRSLAPVAIETGFAAVVVIFFVLADVTRRSIQFEYQRDLLVLALSSDNETIED